MCPCTSKKRLKPLPESYGTKLFCETSYTILEGPPKEKHGEQAKEGTNASQSKLIKGLTSLV